MEFMLPRRAGMQHSSVTPIEETTDGVHFLDSERRVQDDVERPPFDQHSNSEDRVSAMRAVEFSLKP